MIWLTTLFLIIFLLGGLLRLVLFFRKEVTLPVSERSLTRKGLLSIALVNIAFASLGLYGLYARILDPLKILIGVLLVTSLLEIELKMTSKMGSSDVGD